MLRHIKILCLVIIIVITNLSAQEFWEIIGEMKSPVSRAKAVVFNNKIYLIGGYSSDLQEPVDWIQEYDVSTDTWKHVGKLSTKRHGSVAVINNNDFLVFGGAAISNENSLALEQISVQNNFASNVISSHLNFDRTFANGYSIDNSIFIIGGFSNSSIIEKIEQSKNSLPYITEYSVSQDTFVYNLDSIYFDGIMPSMQMSALIGTDIYIFGGIYSGILQSITQFNTTTKSYSKLDQELLVPRAGGSAVYDYLSKKVFIIGGYHELNSALKSVEIFDLNNLSATTTTSLNALNIGRKNPTAVYFNGGIYVFGGEDKDGNSVSQIEYFSSVPVSVVNADLIPNSHDILDQNYPNPFNPSTNISFQIQENSKVKLDIYSILGEHIINLVDENLSHGKYEFTWNSKDSFGNLVPSGVYIYQLRTNNSVLTNKMTLLK